MEGKARCFAVRRGGISGRADVIFHQPWVRARLERLEIARFAAVHLGTVIQEIRYGTGTPPPYLEPSVDTVPFVRATDIKEGEVVIDTLLHIAKDQPKSLEKCRLAGDELVIVRSGVNTGDCAVIPKSLAGAFAAYDLILTFNKTASPQFVSTFLDTEIGRLQLNLVRGRAAQPHINAEEVSALRLPLPLPQIQRELVAAIDAAREERRAKLAEADALLDGLDGSLLATLGLTPPPKDDRKVFAIKYRTLQGRFDPKTYLYHEHTSEKAFPFYPLGSLTVSEPDYGSGSRAVERTSEEQPKYIRITDFRDDGIPLGHEFVTAEAIEEECFLEDGNVLFARSGATAGKTFIYTQDIGPAVFAGYCIRFRFDHSRVLPRFIYFFTKTSAYRQWVATIQRPSGQPNINKPEFKSLEIPVPPLGIQRQVVERLNAERLKVEMLRAEAESGWQAAKRWFEEQLLGPAQP